MLWTEVLNRPEPRTVVEEPWVCSFPWEACCPRAHMAAGERSMLKPVPREFHSGHHWAARRKPGEIGHLSTRGSTYLLPGLKGHLLEAWGAWSLEEFLGLLLAGRVLRGKEGLGSRPLKQLHLRLQGWGSPGWPQHPGAQEGPLAKAPGQNAGHAAAFPGRQRGHRVLYPISAGIRKPYTQPEPVSVR